MLMLTANSTSETSSIASIVNVQCWINGTHTLKKLSIIKPTSWPLTHIEQAWFSKVGHYGVIHPQARSHHPKSTARIVISSTSGSASSSLVLSSPRHLEMSWERTHEILLSWLKVFHKCQGGDKSCPWCCWQSWCWSWRYKKHIRELSAPWGTWSWDCTPSQERWRSCVYFLLCCQWYNSVYVG